jgi:hypothetical protein
MGNDDRLYINGISGVDGEYLVQPLKFSRAAAFIKGERRDTLIGRWLRRIWRIISQPHLGLPLDVDPADLAQAGWAVIFHADEDQAVKDALAPLAEHRRQQVGDDERVKELTYRDGEDWRSWLARHGVGAGSVEPTKVPYYLLLVGGPQRIPFSFGHLLDVEYAVGYLHFDTAAGYAGYVASLIDYETGSAVPSAKEAVFFGTRHAFDPATQLSADLLVNPLADGIPAQGNHPAQPGVADRWGFRTRKLWGAAATKAALAEVFAPPAGTRPPAFLFTASHGIGFPKGHSRQRADQGALVCQDWPGFGQIEPQHYFAAQDVDPGARVHGMIAFHFACYGAGTPSHDRFLHIPGEPPPPIADEPFVAALPQALLTHPGGGALACVGHVERAWSYSIRTPGAGPQLLPFQNAIGRMLLGQPVGYAMKDFNERFAALSTSLSGLLEEIDFGAQVSDQELATNWIERNDAEGYAIIGDPAARLRVNELT